jgi:predicted amidohydrolase
MTYGHMKVAAYQAPLLPAGSMGALDFIRARVRQCEADGVEMLCCPAAILGGLADPIEGPGRVAISVRTRQLDAVLAPLASDVTATIVGFTELGDDGCLYNAAAVFHRGTVAGVYRKLHPAIRQSVYRAGRDLPVFRVGALTFGIAICAIEPSRQSNGARGAGAVRSQQQRAASEQDDRLGRGAKRVDVATAIASKMWVIRADVAGRTATLASHGSSAIVDPRKDRPISAGVSEMISCSVPSVTSVAGFGDYRGNHRPRTPPRSNAVSGAATRLSVIRKGGIFGWPRSACAFVKVS